MQVVELRAHQRPHDSLATAQRMHSHVRDTGHRELNLAWHGQLHRERHDRPGHLTVSESAERALLAHHCPGMPPLLCIETEAPGGFEGVEEGLDLAGSHGPHVDHWTYLPQKTRRHHRRVRSTCQLNWCGGLSFQPWMHRPESSTRQLPGQSPAQCRQCLAYGTDPSRGFRASWWWNHPHPGDSTKPERHDRR